MVLLLRIGPGKAVISINNHTQLINLLERRVFQLLHTLKVRNLKFRPKIWKWLWKLVPKMVLLFKIGPGKAVISINNCTQLINLLERRIFQLRGLQQILFPRKKSAVQSWLRVSLQGFEVSTDKFLSHLRILGNKNSDTDLKRTAFMMAYRI